MGYARKKLGLNKDVVLEKKIEAHAHSTLQGIFKRNDAKLAIARRHFLKDLRQIVAGMERGRVAQILHTGKIGKCAFRAKIGDVLRPLQGA